MWLAVQLLSPWIAAALVLWLIGDPENDERNY